MRARSGKYNRNRIRRLCPRRGRRSAGQDRDVAAGFACWETRTTSSAAYVQAGALACLLGDDDLMQARESVTYIQRASQEALEELRLTVGLLREPGAAELGRADGAGAGT